MATPEAIAQSKIYPCLWFTGQDIEEVAEFYTSILRNSKIERVVTMEDEHPDGTPANVTVVDVTLFGRHFQLMEAPAEHEGFNNTFFLGVSSDDRLELDGYERAFVETSGERTLGGWIIDRYGVRWQTYPSLKEEPSIYPCIWYAGEHAKEMAEFYTAIFPDSSIEYLTPPRDDGPDEGPLGSVTLAEFTLFGRLFNVVQSGMEVEFNDAFSLVVMCDDQEELDRYWNAFLEAGGTPMACGWLIDHFGFRWQIVPTMLDALMADEDPERVKRVTQAMLTMEKIEIAPLEEAAQG